MEKQRSSKKGLAAILILIAAIVIFAGAYFAFREKPVEGAKAIEITVVYEDKSEDAYEFSTDAEYLEQAMDEAKAYGMTYTAEDGPYGAMVEAVNDITADYDTNQAYWAFYVNDEFCNYGISEQPVNDGDSFRIEYTVDAATEADE